MSELLPTSFNNKLSHDNMIEQMFKWAY